MSEFKVVFTKIKEIAPHPDPETTSLDIATVYGFQVVVKRGVNNVGDFLLYIPVDSVLPEDFEKLIFGENSKVKLNNHRVRQIRLRKFPSQGMLVEVATVKKLLEQRGLKSNIEFKLEHCYAELLGVKKYEPPVPDYIKNRTNQTRKELPLENAAFHKYNGLENIKWFPELFQAGEQVVIQEKLHGSNCRAGKLPMVKPKLKHILAELRELNFRNAFTLTKKLIKMNLTNKIVYETVYGSNNVELTNRSNKAGFYGTDIYGAALSDCNAFEKIKEGEIIYGEVVGEGIQKNYNYGHKKPHFVLFDVKLVGESGDTCWLSPAAVKFYAEDRGFDIVPTMFEGPYNKQLCYELTKGPSYYYNAHRVREGIVIKAVEYNNKLCPSNRKSLKWISEEYLDDAKNTDFH